MSDEAAFLRAISAAPNDEGLRMAYADWLEERGDPRAEFLRIQAEFTTLEKGNSRRPILAKRLQQLRPGVDADWLSVVDRAPVENCLSFQFQCPKRWDSLQGTGDPSVRYCDACQRNVYYSFSVGQARRYARRGDCVAVSSSLVRRRGDLGTPAATVTVGRLIAMPPPPADPEEDETRGGPREERRGRQRREEM